MFHKGFPFSLRKLLVLLTILVCLMVAIQFKMTTFKFQFAFIQKYKQLENSNDRRVTPVYNRVHSEEFMPLNTTIQGDSSNITTVAIGMGITFRRCKEAMADLNKSSIIKFLIPSFCNTASLGYEYHFYIAYDFNDPFLKNSHNFENFKYSLFQSLKMKCSHIKTPVHLIKLSYSGKPAWAQNDAMMEAYLDGTEYFYRVNDDTIMKSKQWTESFIKQLADYSPTNTGVTGPRHSGGNTGILTYDFTHINHFNVFGFYYPRILTDWYADGWITNVYKPGRSTKLSKIWLVHTMSAGRRYSLNNKVRSKVNGRIAQDKLILQRYVKYQESDRSKNIPDGKKVISMSLYGSDPKYTYGAIRNAQLTPVIFPDWTLRVYMESPSNQSLYSSVPDRIIKRLQSLGVQIKYIDNDTANAAPSTWRFLVGDDLNVDYFIIRDSNTRLSERDWTVVSEWVKTGKPFHCVRDHLNHSDYGVVDGLWGGRPRKLQEIIKVKWKTMITSISNESLITNELLNVTIWSQVKQYAYCHDSVSCTKFVNAYPFPVQKINGEYIGQTFDEFGEYIKSEINVLSRTNNCTKS